MAGKCDATDEVKSVLRAMAKEKVREGFVDPDRVVSEIHGAIHEHTDLTKGEIADIISGERGGRKATRSELAQKMAAMQAELRDLKKTQAAYGPEGASSAEAKRRQQKINSYNRQIAELQRQIDTRTAQKGSRGRFQGPEDAEVSGLKDRLDALTKERDNMIPSPPAIKPVDPMTRKNAARQAVLEKMIADYNQRTKAGDFAPRTKAQTKYNDQTMKLQAAAQDAKNRWEVAKLRDQRDNRSAVGRTFDRMNELRRAGMLMSPTVYPKLASAALTKIASTTAEGGIKNVLGMLPGLRRVADKAPTGRTTLDTERQALGEAFSGRTIDRMKSALKTGTYDVKSAYGGGNAPHLDAEFRLAQAVNNSHEALKTPLKIAVWKREVLQRTAFELKKAKDAGMTEEEALDHVESPETQAVINGKAWAGANREALAGKNLATDMYNGLQARLLQEAKKGGARGQVAAGTARFLKYEFPITSVPTNWVIQKGSYVGGGVAAFAHLLGAADKGFTNKLLLRNAINNLTEDQADSIMRNLGRQVVGIPLMAMGYYLYKNFGGMYQQGDSKNKNKPDSESIKIAGYQISKTVLENPVFAAMQIGATAAWVAHKPKEDLASGVFAAAKGIASDNPFIEDTASLSRGLSNFKSFGKFAGEQAASFIPAPIAFGARMMDSAKHRKADTFGQEIEKSIPGLRERLPKQD